MGGPFSFLIGLGSLIASGTMALRESEIREEKNQEWKSHKYSHYIQEDYDLATHKMALRYDFDKIKAVIKMDYPNMSDHWVFRITVTAIAKKMMEEETDYEYKIPDQIRHANINLEKYALDEFKREW